MTPHFEVVWDGTRGRSPYLLVSPPPTAPAPRLDPMPLLCLRRRADGDAKPLKAQIYELLLTRDMAIPDIVAHFKPTHSQSKVYSAVASLRTSGHIRPVRREVRVRAKGAGAMWREVYGPATGRGQA